MRIAGLGTTLSAAARRYVPDPFVLAILLTLVAAVAALPMLGWNPLRVVEVWVDGTGGGRGLWGLLAFSMQMCLILVTGYALAETWLVRRVVERLAALPRTTPSAVALVSVVAMSFALLNWGLGLIVGALMAREVGRVAAEEGRQIHYPLVVSAGYCGLMVWHGGFSGSAPLKVTSEAQLLEVLGPELNGRLEPMLLGQTIGSPLNLTVLVLLYAFVPLFLAALAPAPEAAEAAPSLGDRDPPDEAVEEDASGARRLESSFLLILIPCGLALVWLGQWLWSEGLGRLDPNVVNLTLLTFGLLLHGSAKAYVRAVERAMGACSGIVLQYPFYAGIMGILAGSGLVGAFGALLSNLSAPMVAVATFYLGGLVNLFVPSGGGQWAVQGPMVMEAALQSGAPPATILMALAYGDQWTNMVQPFWALPLLGICRVRVGAIMGYTILLMFAAQFIFLLPLILFS